jgi:hypothetical protein
MKIDLEQRKYTTAVYITDTVVRLTPINNKSRLHPVIISVTGQPMILNKDDLRIPDDKYEQTVKMIVKNRINMDNFSRYRSTIELSNIKFSTKHYGDK